MLQTLNQVFPLLVQMGEKLRKTTDYEALKSQVQINITLKETFLTFKKKISFLCSNRGETPIKYCF